MKTEAFAPAKINLTLHVTGQRADGYHLLDSLVVFADIGDRLEITSAPELSMTISGEHAAGVPADARNLAWKAGVAAGWAGHISLEKVLPHGAGIGGGSSDAAAVLSALSQQGNAISDDVPLSLGADVPVCLAGEATRMQGIGDRLVPVDLPHLPAVLVNPGIPIPTPSVFKALITRQNPAMPDTIPAFDTAEECAHWLKGQRNDLEAPAMGLAHEIALAVSELRRTREVLLARMSGSGSTCFALYPTVQAAHLAACEIGVAHPDWWCRAVQLN
ncbi:MAG: 4-(cytidine 5'-diphospho)-2-C-methyl-D-erythritol kinase [Ruegeria sp.]